MKLSSGLLSILSMGVAACSPVIAGDPAVSAFEIEGGGASSFGCSSCALRKQRLKNRSAARDNASSAESIGPVYFRCDHGPVIAATFINSDPGSVRIQIADTIVVLPRTVAASGARYGDGETLLWNKGHSAIFERDGEQFTCEQTDP